MTSTTAPKRRRRRHLALAATVLAILALAVGAVAIVNFQRADPPLQATEIPSLAPADSDIFVVAPFSAKWWGSVAAFDDPNKQLTELNPATAGLDITHVGYSRSADHGKRDIPFTGALRLFYIESPTAAEAAKVSDWLKTSPQAEGRRVYTQGTVVVVGGSWLDSYSTPTTTMAGVDHYTATTSRSTASMWMNPSMEASSLTGKPSARFAEFWADTTGLIPGTTWTGTSTDGATWSGDFSSGGVDPKRVDMQKANQGLRSSEQTLATVVGPTSTAQVIDSGMSGILNVASFTSGNQTLGTPANRGSAPEVNNPVVTVVSDVTGWDAALSGISGPRENQQTRVLSANAKTMVISYTGTE